MTFLTQGKLNIIMDGQFGSTGKGVISGHIAKHSARPLDWAITNAAPNAGHTVDFNDGRGRMVAFHMPVSALWNDNTMIYLCAGSIINPRIMAEEMEKFKIDPARVIIHPHAAILEQEDIDAEADMSSSVTKIASTQKGVGHALSRKIMRRGNVAGNKFNLFPHGVRTAAIDFAKIFRDNGRELVLLEIPQGFSLGVNSGFYPYTTCREISVSQALSDMGMHPHYLGSTMLSLRTYPIRVGNIVDAEGKELGVSGPFFQDSEELTWEQLGQIPEKTTVTKRIRRVATFSMEQYKLAIDVNRPTHVFLNFCNYFKEPDALRKLLAGMYSYQFVTHAGIGPTTEDVIRIEGETINSVVDILKPHLGRVA